MNKFWTVLICSVIGILMLASTLMTIGAYGIVFDYAEKINTQRTEVHNTK